MKSIFKIFILISIVGALVINAKSIQSKISKSYNSMVTTLSGSNSSNIAYLGY